MYGEVKKQYLGSTLLATSSFLPCWCPFLELHWVISYSRYSYAHVYFYIFIIYLVSSNKELIQLVISFEILITVNNMQLLENYSEFNSNRQYEEWSLMRQRDRWCALRRMKGPHLPSV